MMALSEDHCRRLCLALPLSQALERTDTEQGAGPASVGAAGDAVFNRIRTVPWDLCETNKTSGIVVGSLCAASIHRTGDLRLPCASALPSLSEMGCGRFGRSFRRAVPYSTVLYSRPFHVTCIVRYLSAGELRNNKCNIAAFERRTHLGLTPASPTSLPPSWRGRLRWHIIFKRLAFHDAAISLMLVPKVRQRLLWLAAILFVVLLLSFFRTSLPSVSGFWIDTSSGHRAWIYKGPDAQDKAVILAKIKSEDVSWVSQELQEYGFPNSSHIVLPADVLP